MNGNIQNACRAELPDAMEALATTLHYRRGQEIYPPDSPAEYWYRMVRGSARKYKSRPDGRRQIVDFLLPGNFFGLVTAARAPLQRGGGERWYCRSEVSAPQG